MPVDRSDHLAKLARATPAARRAVLRAVDRFGEVPVLSDAQAMTPVKTGFLVASGTTTPAKLDGEVVTKEAGFNADYAAAVHERLGNKHDVGQAKFLSTSLQRNGPRFGPKVAAEVKAELEGGA